MSSGDLGILLGVIFAGVPTWYAYNQDYGILALVGIYILSIYVIGFALGFIIYLISSLFERKRE